MYITLIPTLTSLPHSRLLQILPYPFPFSHVNSEFYQSSLLFKSFVNVGLLFFLFALNFSSVSTATGAVSSASEKYDFQRDYADRGLADSYLCSIHSSEQVSSKNGSVIIKEKKREMLVNGFVSGTSRTSNFDGAVHGGVKGKRSDRDRSQSRDQTRQSSISRAGRLSLDSNENENKPRAKSKQKSTASGHDRFMEAKESVCVPIYDSSLSMADASNNCGKDGATLSGNQDTSQVKESSDFGNLQLHDLTSIEELGGPQDLSSWLNFDDDGLQDNDCIAGLEIPMDDLSDLNMIM